MESKHIKLNYSEAIFAKKELLHSEIDILNVLKRLKNYKVLRKKENTTRNKLKSELTSLRAKTILIESSFPKEEAEKAKRARPRERKIGIEKEKEIPHGIHEELADIREKLARLE